MKHCSPQLVVLTLFVALCTACSTFDLPQERGAILFQDYFNSPASGWIRFHDDSYTTDYFNGVYRIEVDQPNFEAWSVPGFDFSDVLIDVQAKKIAGPNNNVFGVICRYTKPNNFYFFLISSDGYAGIGLYLDGERSLLTGEHMMPAEMITIGGSANHLQAECVGDQLKLYVNDELVYEVQSTALPSGDVGLIAGTYDVPGVTIEFDDFRVRNP